MYGDRFSEIMELAVIISVMELPRLHALQRNIVTNQGTWAMSRGHFLSRITSMDR